MSLPHRFLTSAAALALFYFIIVTAMWNLGVSAQDRGLPTLVPDDPDIVMAEAMVEFRQAQGRLSIATSRKVESAAALDPLEAEPLVIYAAKLLARGEKAQALGLLETASRRNPRLHDAHILLLDEYLRQGNAAGATREIAVLNGLVPGGRKLLSDTLTRLASHPQTRAATLAELSRHPMRKSVLQNMARVGASPFMIIGMSEDLKGAAGQDVDKGWVSSVIHPYIDRGDLAGGQNLWEHFYGHKLGVAQASVLDGGFEGLAAPPFGWAITSGRAGLAQFRNGKLEVEYYGRENVDFARQLLRLVPGSYRLSFKASSQEKDKPNLVWRIECLVSGKTLLNLSLNPSSTYANTPIDEFTIPEEGCPGQWLALSGRPMEFPKAGSIAFDAVMIRKTAVSQ